MVLSGDDSGVVNTYSGFVNGDSGNSQKVFTIKRNGCSRFCGKSVHDKPEWVFTGGRNMHRGGKATIETPDGMIGHEDMVSLQRALIQGHRWMKMLESGRFKNMEALAKKEKTDKSRVAKVTRLTCLAPDIQEAILCNSMLQFLIFEGEQEMAGWHKSRLLLQLRIQALRDSIIATAAGWR
ncbi:hypothetical protein [Endozoicomonas montiporae]|uniref:Putative phage-related protein n=1 Tax=Endozoicomonas montiporae CL-33 TaxID=570277 RepID=A0A142BAP7_9GAMM|nr:hypothetical protein [Endozoicomonas montiporae]AMO55823.1 putative phage-related protein [Endozoicomonas montiporae CL-33]